MNDSKPQAKSPIKDFTCFRELAKNKVKTTTHSNIRKSTSSNRLFKIIFEHEKFRDIILHQVAEILDPLLENLSDHFLSSFCLLSVI